MTQTPAAVQGTLDLRTYDWRDGPVALNGEWSFGSGWRKVPDHWTGTEAGGRNGTGSGTYQLTILLPAEAVPLALRYGTAATAFAIRSDGVELVRVGSPEADPKRAQPAYAPGSVRLDYRPILNLEIFVSNHEYRVGGLWREVILGPVRAIEGDVWNAEAASVALASALAIIGFSTLLLFAFRRKEKTFLHLGTFALLVSLRALVTGEYTLVRIVPDVPFELLIRLEYLTAFLPMPSAVLFFTTFFPDLVPRWGTRLMTWPSWGLFLIAVCLPLEFMTRLLPWYYPISVPTLMIATFLLVTRILRDQQGFLFLAGTAILAAAGLADMVRAAFFSSTGNMIPWGLGLFVALQATSLARRFLGVFDATEALLAEKDLLAKEIHHRVKNSLQVVASLVSLQSNRTEDPGQKAVFHALRKRITAIALVHEKLYGQNQGGRPNVGEYLKDLLRLQYPQDGLGTSGVTWEIHADPLAADVDYCIDAGLILTELVGNAHKHGLLPRGGGQLAVSIRIREGRLGIEVFDDGPGFPVDFRPEAATGLGFRLILALLQRNDGTMTILPGEGGRVHVDLRLPSAAD